MAKTHASTDTVMFPDALHARPHRQLASLPRHWTSLTVAFVAQARSNPSAVFDVDASGQTITYGEALVRATVLSRIIARAVGSAKRVGIMIPPSAGGRIANIATTMAGKVAVNLNLLDADNANGAVRKAKIKHSIVARAAMSRIKVELECSLHYLEDLATSASEEDGSWGMRVAMQVPLNELGKELPGANARRRDTATIMFTTGSTGDPKGVVLSHFNILTNIVQIKQHGKLEGSEVVLGVLPLYHSFGFTVTLWMPAVLGWTIVSHNNPLEARLICSLIEQHGVTVMASTPSVIRMYVPRATREQFKTVKFLLLGSEKLKPELAQEIQDKLGIVPVEGYGATETSPVISANVPFDVVTPDGRTVYGMKPGSVGQVVPGSIAVIVDMNNGRVLPRGAQNEGIIFVWGPQVMDHYLDDEAKTREVCRHGWYYTGDVGYIDEDGFIFITDRLSDFIKMGAEKVPSAQIAAAICAAAQVSEANVRVVAVPDAVKGERPFVLYLGDMEPPAVVAAMTAAGVKGSWIPKAADFLRIAEMPIASTGKLDRRALVRMALEEIARRAEA